jgi:CheY-like chemotaxis protein
MYEVDINDYKLLLIDDDKAYARIKQIFLEDKGFNIGVINNPEEALTYLKDNRVDLILLDYFMPEMTGEKFLQKLREFDEETVVILQTGYSGEKPQDEMLYSLNIQGYYNKEKSNEELMLMVLSAIKSIKLMKEIKRREEEKQLKKLKDKFFADKINTVAGEISEKLMNIGGPAMVLSTLAEGEILNPEQKEFLLKRLGYLKDAASQIGDAVKALNIASESEMTPKSMLEKIKALLKYEMLANRVKLEIEACDDFIFINIEEGTVPYLICKDIQNRAGSGSKNIKVTACKEDDKIIIKILAETGMSQDAKSALKKTAELCDSVNINIEENTTEVIIERVKK